MKPTKARCLLLACGNTLRGDDGIGPWLCAWAEERFSGESCVETISRQQWTPELAQDIAAAETVVFIDCSAASAPGSVSVEEIGMESIRTAAAKQALGTHHVGAPELLNLARELYDSLPRMALLMTVGAGSLELGEEFSAEVKAALPDACRLLEKTVLDALSAASGC
jgi:hydrogenase maturation protease